MCMIELAPSKRINQEVFRAYYELGKAVNIISEFLNEKGFNAQPISVIGNNLNLSIMPRDTRLLITKDCGLFNTA